MSNIGDLNRQIKSAVRGIIDGEKGSLGRAIKLSRQKEELLKPRSLRRKQGEDKK